VIASCLRGLRVLEAHPFRQEVFSKARISLLRRRMIEDMTIRNLSPATQQSYLNAVSKFSRYFGRSPDRLGLEDVHAFQVHLVATGISWPALNQIVCALRFFYGVTLGQATVPERIAYAREPSSCRRRSLLLRLEHAHGSALEDQVSRAAIGRPWVTQCED
jgi:hypothetical protein